MSDLFKIRGFLPYIAVLFLNAFVDLGHKVTIQNTVFKTYEGDMLIMLSAIVNALILLPFVLLFTPAGFLADKFPKQRVMRTTAWGVVGLTCLITLFYHLGWFWAAFAMTFLLAVQSAFYGPAKYGYIREIAGKERLARANGVVQATTTTAILIGAFVFSIRFEMFLIDAVFSTKEEVLVAIKGIGWFLIAGALVELKLAYRLPATQEPDPNLRFDWVKYRTGRYLVENLETVRSREVILLSIIGLALMWSIGQVLLAAFPAFAKDNLGVTDVRVIQGTLASAGIGVMFGSLIAGTLSRGYIETGLIPIGALGVAVCLFILPWLDTMQAHSINLMLLGLLSGLFIVPLNALIQFHAGERIMGRVLAGNSFIQNVVMLGFLALTALFSMRGSSNLLFPLLMIVALGGTIYTVYKLPQSLVRLILTLIIGETYWLHVEGFKHFPHTGGVLMLGKNIRRNFWLFVQLASPRPVRFVASRNIFGNFFSKLFFGFFRAVPGAPNPATRQTVIELLEAGEVVCLWSDSVRNNAEWLASLRDNSDGWVTLPYIINIYGVEKSKTDHIVITFEQTETGAGRDAETLETDLKSVP